MNSIRHAAHSAMWREAIQQKARLAGFRINFAGYAVPVRCEYVAHQRYDCVTSDHSNSPHNDQRSQIRYPLARSHVALAYPQALAEQSWYRVEAFLQNRLEHP